MEYVTVYFFYKHSYENLIHLISYCYFYCCVFIIVSKMSISYQHTLGFEKN